MPLGFFMGMPFPDGIRRMKEHNSEGEVPLMWGINGVMTIIGSVLSVIISMLLGFETTLVVGAFVYLAIFSLYKALKV